MKYESREYVYKDGSSIQLEGKEAVERDEIKGCLFNSNINSADKCVKYEGRIYEREDVLSHEDLINENDDIKMMHHAGRFDGFNGGNGKSIEVIERKAKALEDINVDNVESVQVDECISNGEWNGQLVSHRKYDKVNEWIENNRLYIVNEYVINEEKELNGLFYYDKKGKIKRIVRELSAGQVEGKYDYMEEKCEDVKIKVYDVMKEDDVLDNIYDDNIIASIRISRRNEDIFERKLCKYSGERRIEKVKEEKILNGEMVGIRSEINGEIEEVLSIKEEKVDKNIIYRSGLNNFIVEKLDVMKKGEDKLNSCKLEFKDEGRLYINGGNYFGKDAGKLVYKKNGFKAFKDNNEGIKVNHVSKVYYEFINGMFVRKEREILVNVNEDVILRKRHVVVSERLFNRVKVGDKVAFIYNNMDE